MRKCVEEVTQVFGEVTQVVGEMMQFCWGNEANCWGSEENLLGKCPKYKVTPPPLGIYSCQPGQIKNWSEKLIF